jgi:hypothetical protein
MRSVPVYEHILFNDGCSRTGFEGFDVRNSEFEVGSVVESFGVSGRTIVSVGCVVWTNVVGFSVIVPSDDFEELEVILHLENLLPSVVPEGFGVE